jgi:hypothetical protein
VKSLGQIAGTYRALRLTLVILAFVFPPALPVGGKILRDLPLYHSMSAYYHYHVHLGSVSPPIPAGDKPGQGPMRDVFVGALFALGALLVAYRGFSWLENWALNLAGVLAWGVALFPMDWPPATGGISKHGVCAFGFFGCIAYVCIWRSRDTLSLVPDADWMKKFYLSIYRTLGVLMVLLPCAAWALSKWAGNGSATFWAEFAGVYVFACYWLVKTIETSKSGVDEKAARGEWVLREHGLRDVFRAIEEEK